MLPRPWAFTEQLKNKTKRKKGITYLPIFLLKEGHKKIRKYTSCDRPSLSFYWWSCHLIRRVGFTLTSKLSSWNQIFFASYKKTLCDFFFSKTNFAVGLRKTLFGWILWGEFSDQNKVCFWWYLKFKSHKVILHKVIVAFFSNIN